ncbi:MAG: class I SAM-dependent methyltransferase [Pseudomonadales bacterium]|nr:class I SAM-dependent methyltransferase [Pseudomonadales bacterium]MCP5185593.1 class I SAM-dependent methyltransferase [Pseudomonadales bacterium]
MHWSLKNYLKRHSKDPAVRRRAMNKFFERRLRPHGLHLYKGHLNWALSGELNALHATWGDVPGVPADRCAFLHAVGRIARERALDGDTAECGVRYGKSTFFLLSALASPDKPHHIFDSFEGLSAIGARDRPAGETKRWQAGDIAVGEDVTRGNLAAFSNCVFHKGWIPERFPDVADRRFALVHIDVDLYQPTRDALEFFYPRMVPGGMILCDDYGFASCPGATQAFDDFFADKPEFILPIPTGQCWVEKRGG